jgi:hypothetical protein
MKLQIVARGYYILRIFSSLFIGGFITVLMFTRFGIDIKQQIIAFVLIFCGTAFVIYRISNKVDKAEIELQISDEGLQITWIKQFYLFKKENRILNLNEIQHYLFQPDQHFDMFIIKLKNKKKIKFNLKETSAEFLQFFSDFEEKIKEKKLANPTISIIKAKNMYEKKSALVFAYILSFMMLGTIGLLLFGETKHQPSYGPLFTFLGGSLFYIRQVYIHRKRAKNNQ